MIVGIGYRFSSGALALYYIDKVHSISQEGGIDEEGASEFF
jgi:hypothetical protein